jgi:hypothetical protein
VFTPENTGGFLRKKISNYSSAALTGEPWGKGPRPLREKKGTSNLRTQGPASFSKARKRQRLCQGPAGRKHLAWGIWKEFNAAQVLSASGEKIRPQR